ncbi:Branchpoint-bridging protein, partial [Smittium mucronatum]
MNSVNEIDSVDQPGRKKRKNRWGDSSSVIKIPGAPTAITVKLSNEQLDNYAQIMRIEELSRKLRLNDVIPANKERSPSPEPIYNNEGKRVNTREYRYRKKIDDERSKLIEKQMATNPDFKPPPDYRKVTRFNDKVFLPTKEHPDINFIGLLIGPRGNTLKQIEAKSGCKISIRGKGSIKEGKSRDDFMLPGADEELHAYVVADSVEKVNKGIKVIKDIVNQTITSPESHNKLKTLQLRELAVLNGTLREEDESGLQTCPNCGQTGHRRWECPEQQNITSTIICSICNGRGHLSKDCLSISDPVAFQNTQIKNSQVNSDYLRLMVDLGEHSPSSLPSATPHHFPGDMIPAHNQLNSGYHGNTIPPPGNNYPQHNPVLPLASNTINPQYPPNFIQPPPPVMPQGFAPPQFHTQFPPSQVPPPSYPINSIPFNNQNNSHPHPSLNSNSIDVKIPGFEDPSSVITIPGPKPFDYSSQSAEYIRKLYPNSSIPNINTAELLSAETPQPGFGPSDEIEALKADLGLSSDFKLLTPPKPIDGAKILSRLVYGNAFPPWRRSSKNKFFSMSSNIQHSTISSSNLDNHHLNHDSTSPINHHEASGGSYQNQYHKDISSKTNPNSTDSTDIYQLLISKLTDDPEFKFGPKHFEYFYEFILKNQQSSKINSSIFDKFINTTPFSRYLIYSAVNQFLSEKDTFNNLSSIPNHGHSSSPRVQLNISGISFSYSIFEGCLFDILQSFLSKLNQNRKSLSNMPSDLDIESRENSLSFINNTGSTSNNPHLDSEVPSSHSGPFPIGVNRNSSLPGSVQTGPLQPNQSNQQYNNPYNTINSNSGMINFVPASSNTGIRVLSSAEQNANNANLEQMNMAQSLNDQVQKQHQININNVNMQNSGNVPVSQNRVYQNSQQIDNHMHPNDHHSQLPHSYQNQPYGSALPTLNNNNVFNPFDNNQNHVYGNQALSQQYAHLATSNNSHNAKFSQPYSYFNNNGMDSNPYNSNQNLHRQNAMPYSNPHNSGLNAAFASPNIAQTTTNP